MTDLHRYNLRYDDGTEEFVTAETPSEAVRKRTSVMRPRTITDMTEMANWAGRSRVGLTPFADRAAREDEDRREQDRGHLTWLERMKRPQ